MKISIYLIQGQVPYQEYAGQTPTVPQLKGLKGAKEWSSLPRGQMDPHSQRPIIIPENVQKCTGRAKIVVGNRTGVFQNADRIPINR